MPETESGEKRDLLKTPPNEAREMEELIARGHQANSIVGALTFAGIVILALAGLYYAKLDKLGVQESPHVYRVYLEDLVQNQAKRERIAYGAEGATPVPTWPVKLYDKLRKDIYILAGAAALLALLFVQIEKAKLRRSDLLVYRALAREIEKLRMRVKTLEKGAPAGAEKAESAKADAPGEPPAGTA